MKNSMRRIERMVLSAVGVVLLTSVAQAGPISLTTVGVAHTENFDTLLNSGSTGGGSIPINQEIVNAQFWTGTAGPAVSTGWWNGSGTTFGSASDGTAAANSSRLISYGAAGVAERGLGLGWRQNGGVNISIGGQFQNSTGGAITDLDISYDGEFWYHGGINAVGDLTFDYSLDATSLLDGAATWVSVPTLDFTPPTQGVGPQFTARDGNNAAYRVAGISDTISGLNIADGATFFVRWSNSNSHGMGIDNLSITGNVIPEPTSFALTGLGLAGLLIFRRKH